MSLKAGLIGCGNIGGLHAEALSAIGSMSITAFCDISLDKAKHLVAKYNGEYATTDEERLMQDDGIDAIYVCTRHDSHADLCVRALNAGKHVLVEKPLALSVEECLAVEEAVHRSDRFLMTAFKMRYFELVLKAKALIPAPIMVTMQMMDNRWPGNIWPNDPVAGGGNVLSQGCHSCDIIRFVANSDPVEVYAAGGNYYQETGVVDNLCAVFRFQNGVAGNLVQGDCNTPPLASKFYMQVFAENESITLSDRFCKLVYNTPGRPPQVFTGKETGFVEENRAFVAAIRNGTPPPIDHRDGLYATLMVLQAFASLRSGRPEPLAGLAKTYNSKKGVDPNTTGEAHEIR